MKELYNKINNKGVASNPIVYKEGYVGKIGGYFKENEVIQTIANDILFLLVREYMWLFYPIRTISESGDNMMTSKTQGN